MVEIGRFTRKGSNDLQNIIQLLRSNGVELVDVTGIIGETQNTLEDLGFKYSWSVYSPTRMLENYEADRKKDEVRDILTRTIRAEINYAGKGYVVRAPLFGLANKKIETVDGKRVVPVANPPESDWVIKIFELRANPANTDNYIIDTVNKLGFVYPTQTLRDKKTRKIIGKRGGGGLNYKRLHKIIRNERYAGIVCEKWTYGQHVKMPYFDGLVSIELFNMANRGKRKIIKTDDGYQILTNKKAMRAYSKNNPMFPFKNYLRCDICGRVMKGSAPRGKTKGVPTYHCNYKHKYLGYNKNKMETAIFTFLSNVKFAQGFIDLFNDVVLEVWEMERLGALKEATAYEKRIIAINEEIISIKEKIKALSTPLMIRQFEEDAEKLEASKLELLDTRNNIELNEDRLRSYVKYAKTIMEHPSQLVADTIDPQAQGAIFSVFFNKFPTYTELVNGTPILSGVFELKDAQELSKSQLVTLRGIEPLLPG